MRKFSDRLCSEMIVVVVRNQNEVNHRQLGQRKWCFKKTFRAGPVHRRGALVPNGIHEHVDAINLDEHGRMSHPRYAKAAWRRGFVEMRISAKWTESSPWNALL